MGSRRVFVTLGFVDVARLWARACRREDGSSDGLAGVGFGWERLGVRWVFPSDMETAGARFLGPRHRHRRAEAD